MIERSIAFGANGGLVGTICLPSALPQDGKGIGQVLFNAGVIHRVGPHRINVRLARRLAGRGIASIRFDLAGQGDSQRASGSLSFEEQAVADLRSAMDALQAAAGVRRFVLFGFCSGGWHSYATAPVDDRVAGVILYDTYFFRTWKTRLIRYLMPIRERGLAKVAQGWIARRKRSLQWWKQTGAWSGAGTMRSPSAGLLNAPPAAEFAARIRQLHDRGTRVAVIHSGGFEYFNYRNQFRDVFERFGIVGITDFLYFPDMSHTATRLAAQAEFIGRLEEWIAMVDTRCRERAAVDGR